MDALLQIVIPAFEETGDIRLKQPVFELDGFEYPRNEPLVTWRGLALQFDEKTPYLERFLPPNYLGDDWIWLKVPDELLEEYDLTIKNDSKQLDETRFENFLRLLLNPVKKWLVAFILHYDQIDNVYPMDVDQVIKKLRSNLVSGGTTEGFIAYRD